MIEQEKIKFVRELFNPKVNKVTQLLKAKNKSNFNFAFALLKKFSKEISDGFLHFFIQNFSKKIESKNTYSQFNDILLNALNDIDLNDSFKEYLLYKLNFLSAKEYYYQNYFLSAENILSLIDRY